MFGTLYSQWKGPSLGFLLGFLQVAAGQTLYEFGNPTAEEQLHIELINRARANPTAEGIRISLITDPLVTGAIAQFGVNLTEMKKEFALLPAYQPLAPSASLTQAARGHSQWMFANGIQSHDETNPSNTPSMRMTAAGYSGYGGENVYAYAADCSHGHAAFEVDWGPGGTFGMLAGRGHRANIHHVSYREIGVGLVLGSSKGLGPQIITQDFGYQLVSPSFATGVAYYDLNQNNFYDVGEGIPNLDVSVTGSSYTCKTASGGGWVVPVPTNPATRTVTFSGLGLNQSASIVMPNFQNAKLDLKLNYLPPNLTSSGTAWTNTPHYIWFQPVPGASSYRWDRWTPAAAPTENCDAETNFTISKTGTYNPITGFTKFSGTGSLHLENSTGANQSAELKSLYYCPPTGTFTLTFHSRLKYATTSESVKVQVREEGTSTWRDLYSQTGTSTAGEAGFTARSVSLSSLAGKSFRLRFLLQYPIGGSYYQGSGDIYGWFIDNIVFTNVSALTNNTTQSIAGPGASFTPALGTYLMALTPIIGSNSFACSYQTLVVSAAPSPSFLNWAKSMENANGLASGAISTNPNADPDGDGLTNLAEYAFTTSPMTPLESSPRLPALQSSATHYVLRYQRDTSLTDITLTPLATTNLATWRSPGQPGAPPGFADALISTSGTIQTREASIPKSSGPTCFLQIRVNRP